LFVTKINIVSQRQRDTCRKY